MGGCVCTLPTVISTTVLSLSNNNSQSVYLSESLETHGVNLDVIGILIRDSREHYDNMIFSTLKVDFQNLDGRSKVCLSVFSLLFSFNS